ncbi:Aim18p [Sporobolomyces koalae]|uniref:Aim18p n=1 Tax=Sporobolomyces koalae TaxID=500713 RepID=UPI00317B0B05
MFQRAALRAGTRSTVAWPRAPINPFGSTSRSIHSTRAAQLGKPWAVVAAITGAAGVSYALYDLKPDVMPSLPIAHAEAIPSPLTYLDPTTKTPFPSTLVSPEGVRLQLVGTGVRTVSFLSIRVYSVGFYVSERELAAAKAGTLQGWQGYTPERLIAPHTISSQERATVPTGEALIDSLLEKADAAVVIVPLRNTSLPHLRDGFSRALVARMKVPAVAAAFDEHASERTGAALVEFKSFFPNGNLAKGAPMELYYSAVNRSVQFQIRETPTAAPTVLGTLRDGLLSQQLMVSYFSDTAAPSEELRKSVAMGFAGEAR